MIKQSKYPWKQKKIKPGLKIYFRIFHKDFFAIIIEDGVLQYLHKYKTNKQLKYPVKLQKYS